MKYLAILCCWFLLTGFLMNPDGITIDGYDDDWNSYPSTYEYNWDNSQNCWEYGVWIDGEKYTTSVGEYDTNVRHKMNLTTKDGYIYCHITFARDYSTKANGDDYNFTVNGVTKKYRVCFENGEGITGNTGKLNSTGSHRVYVYADNNRLVEDSAGAILKTAADYNYSLEIKIPLSEFEVNELHSVEFYCPNLMYRPVINIETPTDYKHIFTIIISILVIVFIFNKYKHNQLLGKEIIE